MARHNLASEKGASIIWGQRELQLREGMLSVFIKDDTVQNILFRNENRPDDKEKYIDLGSVRDTISVSPVEKSGSVNRDTQPMSLTAPRLSQSSGHEVKKQSLTRKSSVT